MSTGQEDIPEKKSLILAVCKGILVSIAATIGASALVGKSKTFLKKENLGDTALEFTTSLIVFGGPIVGKAIEHNKHVDELTSKKAGSFAQQHEQEKLKASEISASR